MTRTVETNSTAQTINDLIDARKDRAKALSEQEKSMRTTRAGLLRFKSLLASTREELTGEQNPEPRIVEAIGVCADAIKRIDDIVCDAEKAESEIHANLPHFTRNLFCVAEAGGTQSGKSTTLQKIVGMDENDPNCPIIGGGDGASTTAARCIVVNIGENERPGAQIQFFKPDEFMKDVVTPYAAALRDKGITSLPRLDTLADFEAFDVEKFELEARGAAISPEVQQWVARFANMRKKYEDYKSLLGLEHSDPIPLNEAVQYIVYPTAKQQFMKLPYKCIAVKEATLYCQFPNAVVSKSAYIDLPGAGENAPDVEKRYTEGFNLSTDLVLFVGRYDVKPYTNDQVKMVDNLYKIVPVGQLDNFMIYFQNDFGAVKGLAQKLKRAADINSGAPTPVYAIDGHGSDMKIYRIEAGTEIPSQDTSALEVEKIGAEGRVVIFGKGNDSEYVTQTLVPLICSFAAIRLPLLDAALVKSTADKCESVKQSYIQFVEKTKAEISKLLIGMPSAEGEHIQEIINRAEQLKVAFLTARRSVENGYRKQTLLVAEDRSLTPVGIQGKLLKEIDAEDSGLLIEPNSTTLLRKIEQAPGTNVMGTVEKYVRSIRLRITERFSKLEDIYDSLICNLLNHVFTVLCDANSEDEGRGVPFLSSDDGKSLIQVWVEALESAGCPVLAAAAKDFAAVRVPFYQSVYPDIRKTVFNRPDYAVVQEEFHDLGNAQSTVTTLRELAHDWAYDTGDSISLKNVAREIVYCAAERFFDRTLYSPESDREFHLFVTYWWPRLAQGGGVSQTARFRERFASLLQQINSQKGA